MNDKKILWFALTTSFILNISLIAFLFFTINRFLPPLEKEQVEEKLVPLPPDTPVR